MTSVPGTAITIVGAGAIGGTIGAYLARAGESVQLVDGDVDHVRAMRRCGLTIHGFAETFTTPVEACLPADLTAPLDVVLLAVKAQHTLSAVYRLLPLLTPDTVIVSMQNGLCEREIAAQIGEQRTVGCFVNFSADYLEPGLITYGGPGSLYVGELDGRESDRVHRLRQILSVWGSVQITKNIWGYLWGKMGYANMLFATALANVTMADAIDRYRTLMVELAAEIYEVADREGVVVESFDGIEPFLIYPRESQDAAAIGRSLDALIERRRRDGKTKSGIWRDLAVRRRPTEVDHQIGLAVQIGAGYSLEMPLTRRLVAMVHELEAGTRHMSWDNLDELDALRIGAPMAASLHRPAGARS